MLTMPEVNSIKCLRSKKSLSINPIEKMHNISWSTGKKQADSDQLPKIKVKKKNRNDV